MVKTRNAYIVWNEALTEGYVTFDRQVAYEARKGAESNCSTQDGTQMLVAQAFCQVTGEQDCTVQVVEVPAQFDPEDFHRRSPPPISRDALMPHDDARYLRDLAETLRRIPVMYGTDDGDIARLHEIAKRLDAKD